MERRSGKEEDAINIPVNNPSSENDPQGSALSYEGPTPQPIQGEAPSSVPRAEVSRLSAVTVVGGAVKDSSPVIIPLNDDTLGADRVEESKEGPILTIPISSASASSSQVPRLSRDPRLRPGTPELRQAAAREREEEGAARALTKAIEQRLDRIKLEEELERARSQEARKRKTAESFGTTCW